MDPTYSDGGTRLPFLITLVTWAVGERVLTIRDAIHRVRQKGSQDRGTVWWAAGAVLVAVGGGFAFSLVGALNLPDPIAWVIVGLTAAWIGMLLRVWAVTSLGRYFTTIVVVRDDYELVSTGPYRWLLHPSYTGLLLTIAGLGCAFANGGSFLVMAVVPVLGLRRRIVVEEAALRGQFGARYDEYAAHRSRLIPGIW